MAHFSASPARLVRSKFVLFALLLALAVSLGMLSATSASAITRDQVLARAQTRIDAPVPYSQSKYYAGYRTDCSGYVSMCWATGTSWNTRSFYRVTKRITLSQLAPGDALLKPGYHIRLFYGWVDDAHTQYVAYESSNGKIAGTRIHSISEDLAYGYYPARYNGITNSPVSRNLLKNPSFNTWVQPWGSNADRPVWWQVDGPRYGQLIAHRKDVYRSANNSLKLFGPGSDSDSYSELSQTAPVVAGAPYRLTAWAATSFDPKRVALRVVYLNAAGASLSETITTGDHAGLIGASFKSISLLATSPPSAVKALVSVRLAGGTNTSGTVSTGSAATIDDISFVRPQITVGIKPSATTSYRGKTITLSGAVTPNGAIGTPAMLYVLKPGSSTWAKIATSNVYASGSGAAWKGTYAFTSSATRGTYKFRTGINGIPGFIGATSTPVSVVLK